ncbi:MAG: DUF4340 domain-containing protein [Verrucomicrobia bacterium]|nr:DUF4340 domain-containing protein [Verrucomicrobiota bacterium]
MRSLGFTFVLALTAACLCALAIWQWRQGNFDSIFGAPPTTVGQRIYDSFTPNEVKHIRIVGNSTSATFSLRDNGWQAATPWSDRMDPRAAMAIIHFTLGMRVEDLAHEDEVNLLNTKLNENAISIRLEDANHAPIAKFKLGRVTPWKAEVEDIEQPVPTVFVQPRDRNHKRYIYACTGDITPLFKDGLKFLRDHRPFYFNPTTLRKIRIRSQQGDLTLGRETPQSPWRIVKPLDLPTDAAAMKKLLEGVFELQAVKVSDRAAVTLPANDKAAKTNQIAIVPFGSDTETLLELYPPESPEAHEVKATVSDRPNTIFDLPLKPEPGFVSLADLPLSVNELRDPTLTHLNIQSLLAITIQPATGTEIVISRTPPEPWMATLDGMSCEANEENLYALLKAITIHRAIGFESDATTDFSPWGLNRPFLTLRLLGQDNQSLELRFGMDGKGGYFVNRLGTPSVMRVDETLIAAIAVHPYEWRHARIWSVDRVNLIAIELKPAADPPLILKYKFIDEAWQAERDGQDLSASLDPARANFMLSVLEGLKVSRWLAANDEAAATALTNPVLAFTVIEKTFNDNGDFSGLANRKLTFAPAAKSHPNYYYGRLSTETHPFLIDRETYQKLAAGLFDK